MVARYACSPAFVRGVSESSRDILVFEGALQTELNVPMSHCAMYETLEAFLSYRPRASTARILFAIVDVVSGVQWHGSSHRVAV